MKTIPPACPEPENGVKYWRSLDALEGTPEFQSWVDREFPAGASELTDPVTRRDFMRLMSASFALAGVGAFTGCRRPVEKIYPFGKQPENYIHGVPQNFATAMPTRHGAIPLVVKSHEGRPIKIEGNAQHPINTIAGHAHGGTDVFAQASLLNLYDSDRAQRFTKGVNGVAKETALDQLSKFAAQFAANGGAGVAVLMESANSPSRERLIASLAKKWPNAKWFTHDAVDLGVTARAASLATGKSVQPQVKLENADVILSLDCDFIGTEEDAFRLIRGFAQGRKISERKGDKQEAKMSRLYAVEALMTQTGANADHRLRVASSHVIAIAAAVAAEVVPGSPDIVALARKFPLPAGVKPEWAKECAKDLAANRGKSVVVAGHRQPLAVHLIAHILNAALENLGKTVVFRDSTAPAGSIEELAQQLGRGVELLVILGSNPAFTAPANLNFTAALKGAKSIVRLGYHEDETFAALGANGWQIPVAHYLESWGDARTSDGTLVSIQPLIAPLFDGLTETEVLARLGASESVKAYDIARETFAAQTGGAFNEEKWKRFLHDGFLPGSASEPASVGLDNVAVAAELAKAAEAPKLGQNNFEVVFARDYKLDDGRYANNGWLQELPDPITKLVWDNAVLLSRKTAAELGVDNNDLVTIELGGRKVTGAVWIQPGQADYVAGLALGYGRERGGRIANFKTGTPGFGNEGHTGFNAYALRTNALIASGAKVSKTGGTYRLICTQDHWSMEGRPIIREANLAQFNEKPEFAKNMDLDAPEHSAHIPKDPKTGLPLTIYTHPYKSNPALKSDVHQWGMTIDLNSCTGCSACVIACQSENNIPIVGKDQVWRNREMHWMRIDRYYTGLAVKRAEALLTEADEVQQRHDWIDDAQVVNQPMLCQHCEAAPCESVCPVNATVHDEEGLNVMAYNRCVGTRYCSNNCAWKVRRFNFFDFNKRPLEKLYFGPTVARGADEMDLVKLAKNPDVTVRMRGVMEKCTFCVQRIEQAKIAQKVKAGASSDVQVKDGTIKTACQQACPADAIVFGNTLDANSRVSRLKAQQRNYSVLGFLDNRPRVTYLARVRNPNPAMPDYKEHPLPYSLDEYTEKNGSPFEAAHHGGGHDAEKKGAH